MQTLNASFPIYYPAYGKMTVVSTGPSARVLDEAELDKVGGAGWIGMAVGAVVGGAVGYGFGRLVGLSRLEAAAVGVVGAEGGALIGALVTGVI